MQLSTLLPLLALLASPIAAREPIDARRNLARHNKHVRAVDEAARNMQRRDVLAAEKPRARKVKRGANGCRVRGSSFAANSTSSATSATSAAASATSSTVVIPSSAASAAPSPAASSAGGEDWTAPSSSAAWSAAPSSAAPSQSSAPASSGGSSSGAASGEIGGKKAGLCGENGLGIYPTDKFSWLWNYTPALYGSSSDGLSFIPTLWGAGVVSDFDSERMAAFKAISNNPSYVQGFYEPDCSPPMSSAVDPSTAASLWNELIVPHRASGAQLISPGMCKQADEDWLTPFKNQIGDSNMWDITSVHINKPDVAGARKVLDHYAQYGKPMLITEFACVNDANGFNPVEDQGQINQYINDVVDLFQNDARVIGYSMSQGDGLAWNWAAVRDGALTESGQTYLNAVSKYY